MVQGDIINIYTSHYTWRLENVRTLRKLGSFQKENGISIQPIEIEFTRFKWHSKMYENYDKIESETELELYIYCDRNLVNGFYDKFTYNCEIEVITESGEGLIPQSEKDKPLIGVQFLNFAIPRAYEFVELRFTVYLKEHDLSGSKIRSADSVDYKRNLLQDLRNLQRDVINTDLIIDVEGCEIRAHKAILAMRSTVFDSMIKESINKGGNSKIYVKGVKFWAFSKFLKFLYSGCIFLNHSKEELNIHNNLIQKYCPTLVQKIE